MLLTMRYPIFSILKLLFDLALKNPISPEILRVVAARVQTNERNDHLLLSPETEEVGPYELPLPREVSGLETYVPAYLNVSHLRRLSALVA
jgi:myosin-5